VKSKISDTYHSEHLTSGDEYGPDYVPEGRLRKDDEDYLDFTYCNRCGMIQERRPEPTHKERVQRTVSIVVQVECDVDFDCVQNLGVTGWSDNTDDGCKPLEELNVTIIDYVDQQVIEEDYIVA
jgi:hypothetical protein